MGNDHLEFMGGSFKTGNNFSLSLHRDSEELARKLFDNLSAGGTVTMPLEKVFWGAYFGMFTDKFGIQWMVNHDYKQPNFFHHNADYLYFYETINKSIRALISQLLPD